MTYKPIQVIVNKIMPADRKKRGLKCGSGFVIVKKTPRLYWSDRWITGASEISDFGF
jgi:hypothetical protein